MDTSAPEDTPVAQLKNLGIKTGQMLNEIGIFTKKDLEETGILMAYKILQHRFSGVNILFLYSMYGALVDCHWNHLPAGVKASLQEDAAIPLDIIPGSSSMNGGSGIQATDSK